MDMVIVPMVESAFQPWPFPLKKPPALAIYSTTGQQRGLTLADGYDGRYDIHASTKPR